MVEPFEVVDGDGNVLGTVPISPQQYDALKKGSTIEIKFHTPRMLREKIPVRNGVFQISESGGLLVVNDVEAAKQFLALRADIENADA